MEKNKQKFTETYNEYSDVIFRYCLYKISDREKALDFVQETFVRTWQYIQKGNDVENMKTFLYTTAKHIIIDEYRKKKAISLDTLTENGQEPYVEMEEKLYASIDAKRVMEHVLELPKNYSSVIIMRYISDLSVQEIAKVLGESENVVSVRIHRGLSKLKLLVHV